METNTRAWILAEMASTFYVLAFADACDRCAEAGTPHPHAPGPGGSYDDCAAEAPVTCTVYQIVGQHSSGDLRHCISRSTPATADEPDAARLLAELRGAPFNYSLRVVGRCTQWMHEQRYAAARS